MTAKTTALESCAARAARIAALLDRVEDLKNKTLRAQTNDPKNWGHEGDMARIEAALIALFAV